MLKSREELAETMWTIICIFGFFFIYSLSTPTNVKGETYLYFYPVYESTTLRAFFILGTWMWIYLINYHLSVVANSKFTEKWYNVIVGSSLYVYISHYLWIMIVMRAVTIHSNFTFGGNVIFAFVFT